MISEAERVRSKCSIIFCMGPLINLYGCRDKQQKPKMNLSRLNYPPLQILRKHFYALIIEREIYSAHPEESNDLQDDVCTSHDRVVEWSHGLAVMVTMKNVWEKPADPF